MSNAVFPQVSQVAALNSILSKAAGMLDPLTLRLYSNNRTPSLTDVAGDYNEVTGGGYAAIVLDKANFAVVAGTPSAATYNAFQQYTFTGATGAPSTVYGYYITDANTVLVTAERFDVVPFIPNNGAIIKVMPKITQGSVHP